MHLIFKAVIENKFILHRWSAETGQKQQLKYLVSSIFVNPVSNITNKYLGASVSFLISTRQS